MRTRRTKSRSKRELRRKPVNSSSSSKTSSTTIQRYYQRFCRVYRHPFGSRTSPYRKRARKWLRSLKKGDEFYICDQCSNSKSKCDRDELRCQSCVDRHACCPRTAHFRKIIVMEELKLTEGQFRELEEYIPKLRGRKRIIKASSEEDESGVESGSEEDSEEEMIDELDDDSEAGRPLASSSKAVQGKGSMTRSRKSTRIQNACDSSTPPLSQLRPNGHVHSRSRPTSTDAPTSTSQHDDQVWIELASIHSRLNSIGETVKAGLSVLCRAENKGADVGTKPLPEAVPASNQSRAELASTQPHEPQMVVDTLSPGVISGSLSARTQMQIDSNAFTEGSHQSITSNDTQPVPLDTTTTADFAPVPSSDPADLPFVGNGEQYDQLMDLPDSTGGSASTPPGVLPSIETIN